MQVNKTLVGIGLSSIKHTNSSLYSVCFEGKAYTSNSAVCPIFTSIEDLGNKNGVFCSPDGSPFFGGFPPLAFGSKFASKFGSVDCPGIYGNLNPRPSKFILDKKVKSTFKSYFPLLVKRNVFLLVVLYFSNSRLGSFVIKIYPKSSSYFLLSPFRFIAPCFGLEVIVVIEGYSLCPVILILYSTGGYVITSNKKSCVL